MKDNYMEMDKAYDGTYAQEVKRLSLLAVSKNFQGEH